MSSDVTAVLLTTGEPTFERSLASVRAQTYELADTIVIEGLTPFHRAFNAAVAAVRTPYFIQVDADMILEPTCVAELRARMAPDVGIVGGLLRDPLAGRVPAVKLFRMVCLAGAPLPNTIAPEVDHYRAAGLSGWPMVYALRHSGARAPHRYTFGEHLPGYTPDYTFSTYFLLGSRFRYLRDPDGLRWRRDVLMASRHRHATLARLALGHGVFFSIAEDVPKSYPDARKAGFLEDIVRSARRVDVSDSEVERSVSLPPPEMFEQLFALGAHLGQAAAGATLRRCLEIVAAAASEHGWLAEAALAHGLFVSGETAKCAPEAFATVAPLLQRR